MSSGALISHGEQLVERSADPAALLGGRRLYVASNRGPVHYQLRDGRLVASAGAGGLVTALRGVANQTPMTWIASALGAGDRRVASQGNRPVPVHGSPDLRFVVAPEETFRWFYHTFANPLLWFLQHGMWDRLRRDDLPRMIENGWMRGYRPMNEAFARSVGEAIAGVENPVVLVQDYHFYLMPDLLRRRSPRLLIQHFTHIPWPEPSAWEVLPPWIRRDVCRGLLGADVVGFQTAWSADNFLRCCRAFLLDVRVDLGRRTVRTAGRTVQVRDYPISIDAADLRRLASSPEVLRSQERLRPLLGEQTVVRVDRLDPSKNVAAGFRAFGLLLERRRDLIGKVRFLAFLVPSRESIPEYAAYAREVWREVDVVNRRFGRDGWKPIQVFHEDNRAQSMAGMRLADILLVNPVADGMNLVAKEGPIVNNRDSVLVLSSAAGAHQQLRKGAISVPPHDVAATAAALEEALGMSAPERRRRASVLRTAIESEGLDWWVGRQLEDLLADR